MKRKLIVEDEIPSDDVASMASSDTDGTASDAGPALPWLRYRRHDRNASIVFVGPRGTGTSSLAVIAASVLGWKIIDCDREFEKLTGSTKQQYRSSHGVEHYRQRKIDVVQALLEANAKRCVFACGAIILRKKNTLFLRYAQEHPIVYVIRERKSIQDYLGLANDERWEDAVEHMHFFFRQRSNYEFFNLDEAEEPRWQTTLTSFLETKSRNCSRAPQILRKTRAHVAILLRNIFGSTFQTKRYGDIQTFPEPEPELRQGSHVLCIDLDDIKRDIEYLRSLDTGHDAVQLNITASAQEWHSVLSQETLAWALATLRRQLDIPIIVNVSTPRLSSGAIPSEHPKSYGLLLHLILRLAPEYLTVDLRSGDQVISQVVQSKGLTRLIGYLHVEQPLESRDLESMLSQYHRARNLGCDLVSLSGLSRSLHDNLICQQLSQSILHLGLTTPAIVFNIGGLGRLSQILNPVMTPVIPDVQSKHSEQESITEVGLTTSQQLRMAWHMLVPTKRTQYYVFGAEVRQSLSPAMHNAGFNSCGLPFTYQAHESPDFSSLEEIASRISFGGASISLPFKSKVLALVAKQSPAVQMIGAANTLLPLLSLCGGLDGGQEKLNNGNRPAQLMAENTDWMGIYVCIAKHCTPANHITKETSALVIGAGGIARAAIYALVKLGFGHILILNRTYENALNLKEHFKQTCGEPEDLDHDLSSESQTTYNPTFHVLESCDEPWPGDVRSPSVIVCAIPARATKSIPEYPPELRYDWFSNPTGGLVADVSAMRIKFDFADIAS